jgi:hypothetical protein
MCGWGLSAIVEILVQVYQMLTNRTNGAPSPCFTDTGVRYLSNGTSGEFPRIYLSPTESPSPYFIEPDQWGIFPVFTRSTNCDFCDFQTVISRSFPEEFSPYLRARRTVISVIFQTVISRSFPELCSAAELPQLRFKPSRDLQPERRSGHPRAFQLFNSGSPCYGRPLVRNCVLATCPNPDFDFITRR